MGDIARTQVSFRIGADAFDRVGVLPDATIVTKALGVEPSRSRNAGVPSGPSRVAYKNGQWALESPSQKTRRLSCI